MKKLFFVLFLSAVLANATGIKGSFSSAFYMGTPFWNADNYSNGNTIAADDAFYRSLNQLRLDAAFGSHFSFRLNMLRSDGFQGDNHLSETKFYQAYAQYSFSSGFARLGRFVPFNRWIWGSVDGASVGVSVGKHMRLNILGGLHVPYGLFYDSDRSTAVGYGDLNFRYGLYGAKAKFFYSEQNTKAGLDLFGRNGKLNYGAGYGYDFTNNQTSEGSLHLIYLASQKMTLNLNYRLYMTEPWKLGHTDFNPYMIERVLGSINYRLWNSYSLDWQEMLTMTSKVKDYLSMLTVSGSFFTVGASYLNGESDFNRLGLVLGLHHTFLKSWRVSAGVAPTTYQLVGQSDHQQTMAYYFRSSYRLFKNLSARLNVNFYQDNPALESKYRGGLQLNYFFGSK